MFFALLIAAVALAVSSQASASDLQQQFALPYQNAPAKVSLELATLPLIFEPNMGQTDAQVRFLARGGAMTTFLGDSPRKWHTDVPHYAHVNAYTDRRQLELPADDS